MNVLVNILDNNLLTFKEAKIISPLDVSETSKKNGQSKVASVDSKCYESTPGDVGNIGEAGDLLCLVLVYLVAVPSVVPAKAISWSPPSVGLSTEFQIHA
ncbi:hypothetical protein DSO57_1033595 [Entomophthora muscae]|uniref:Uncharacterized protein n=1 Tax=Entomophthora muscae TaxID=34485 RepID=A0ACC2SPC0_9FUNG|nr:hypothetical protein DSO57_1033595 [Entomophthora muscae]